MSGISENRQTPAWRRITVLTATAARRELHKRDHKAIVDAIVARDGAEAREAMRRHLQKVLQFMTGTASSDEDEEL